jgi:RNA-directed DNA polymerase
MDSPGTWERPPTFSQAENVKRVAPVEGDQRRSAKEAEEAYEPVVPMRTGNCGLRCRRTRRREAGNKTTHRSKETSRDTELGERMSTELERISKLAGENRQLKFLSIAHLLTPEALMEAFKSLRKDASAGVDGVAYGEYRMEVGRRIQELYERVRGKRYRAQPLRRIYIPKEGGKQRPIWFCCKNLLTIQDVVTRTSSSLLQNVAKIFFATEPCDVTSHFPSY